MTALPLAPANGSRTTTAGVFPVQILGDANYPTLSSGDVVFLDTGHTEPSPPGLYGIRDMFGNVVIHRLRGFIQEDRRVLLIGSDNPKQGDYVQPYEDVEIVGRVCGIFKTL